jgi:hypothetical protein
MQQSRAVPRNWSWARSEQGDEAPRTDRADRLTG